MPNYLESGVVIFVADEMRRVPQPVSTELVVLWITRTGKKSQRR